MRILFVHQYFPGQFKFLAASLAAQGHEVVTLTHQPLVSPSSSLWEGVKVVSYHLVREYAPSIQPWLEDLEKKVVNGESCLLAAMKLKEEGFRPDIVISHTTWGECLFLKEVWPSAKFGIYFDCFFNLDDQYIAFDPEFQQHSPLDRCWMKIRNINYMLHFEMADAGICPTHWQHSTYPDIFRSKISVIHDGINTDQFIPNPHVSLQLSNQTGQLFALTPTDKIITFISRNLEPCRGFHIFMRSLPEILGRHPNARVIIVGSNDTDSLKPDSQRYNGMTWRDIFTEEIRIKIPQQLWNRVSFLGKIPYKYFIPLLQLSTVHVHMSYPLVLSWTPLEAMSTGCVIVASNTPPVREFITHNQTGRLVDFFDTSALANHVCELLDNPDERQRLSSNAREFVKAYYDLKRICLPKQLAWVEAMISS